jgi:tRNA(fMet)-specific endonuclease VapC
VEVNVALDTNAYSDFMRGQTSRTEIVYRANLIFVPLIVIAELRSGFAAGELATRNEIELREFLREPQVSILPPDEETTHHYARLYAYLRRSGRPIPTNDLWIAALVVQHGLVLCTSDAHFDHLPQIPKC